jgi:gamma-glutamylaminecyclotransferase
MAPSLVFVYGTLKRGYSNHHWMKGEFQGVASLNGFTLHSLGPYPGMVPRAGGRVLGEVWLVPEVCLEQLDILEDVATNMYRREKVVLSEPAFHGCDVIAYVYIADLCGAPEIGQEWLERA